MLRVHCAVPEIQTGTPTELISPQSYGCHGEGETPGPIPNPEAKPFSADGTALVTVWESRTQPDILSRGALDEISLISSRAPFLFCWTQHVWRECGPREKDDSHERQPGQER